MALFIVELDPRRPSPTPRFGRPRARNGNDGTAAAADALAGLCSHRVQGRNSKQL